jgi:hypothetical protein
VYLPRYNHNHTYYQELGLKTKQPEVLVCYHFHFKLSNEEEDLIFDVELKFISLRTIIIPKPTRLEQIVIFIPLANIGLLEQVFDILVEPIFVLPIQIVIPHDIF